MKPADAILVTGASGFIGGWLVEALWLSGRKEVRAGIRQWSSAARIARFPMDIVLCDITDQAQIARAMAGAQVVVHCAYNDTSASIVQGTRNMLQAAHEQGVKRFVYLSTAEVYGGTEGVVDEATPYGRTENDYANAKIEAETLCWSFAQRGLPVTILRPSIVYGPFGRSWTVKLATRLQSDRWGTFEGFGDGFCNLVYIEDLISAVVLAMDHDRAVGEAFNVNGSERVTWNGYFERYNQALGLPPLTTISTRRSAVNVALNDRVRGLTGALLKRYGDTLMKIYMDVGVARSVMKRVKQRLLTSPSGKELRDLYSRKAYYTDSKARRLLGYTPKVDLATGLSKSVRWLDHHGFTTRSSPFDATDPRPPIVGRDAAPLRPDADGVNDTARS